MKLINFSKHFFLASGVIWTLCALSILLFQLNFQRQEILITLILPLAYAIIKTLEKPKVAELQQ